MELTLPLRKNLSASKSIPANVNAGPPALTATTKRLEIGSPLEELAEEELLVDEELVDAELLEDELPEDDVIPLEDCPPQPVTNNKTHAIVHRPAEIHLIVALITMQHPNI